VDLIGSGADLGHELARSVEQRAAVGIQRQLAG